jgi:ADP-ribose pyrophosphatase YjhB (NUDIX family)
MQWDTEHLIPHELFETLCGKLTMSAVELMVTRRKTPFHAPELLLIKRPEDSKDVFRGQWHGPGSLFYGHESPESVLARIVRKELGGRTIGPPVNLGAFHSETPRGNVLAMLMVTSFPGEGELPPDSGWFYEGDLPEPLVESHRQLI